MTSVYVIPHQDIADVIDNAMLIVHISRRAEPIMVEIGVHYSVMDLQMDLTLLQLHHPELINLDKLLAFGEVDFIHDVLGIMRHLNRDTGELGNCFVPRCAKV